MSILLSAYFPEGIVFAADKNVTCLYPAAGGLIDRDTEVGTATKVVPWAYRQAVAGFCGLGELAGLTMAEWMRQFAAATRGFDDLACVAHQMRDALQCDFDRDYPEGTDIRQAGLIVHFGGFRRQEAADVPAMYYIRNVPGLDLATGIYDDAVREFFLSDELQRQAEQGGVRTASQYRTWLERIDAKKGLLWYNNGAGVGAFNVLKQTLWAALMFIREQNTMLLPADVTLSDRVAYCAMSVELFGSFYRYHYQPKYRTVGGGVNVEWVRWPESAPASV